jgi:cysteine desulfuration protein SufE
MDNPAAHDLVEEFALLDDWEQRYRYVIELGRELEPLSDAEHNEDTRVRGCASQVWLVSERTPEGALHFRGDSDAHIVRGLIAILMRLFDRRAPQEILDTDAMEVFRRLDLAENLSQQRSNGLAAMIERMRADARAALAPA